MQGIFTLMSFLTCCKRSIETRLTRTTTSAPLKKSDYKYERCDNVIRLILTFLFFIQVAELIPEDWSIALLSKFLLNSVRSSLHDGRQCKVARQLAFRDYYLANKDYLQIRATQINLTDNK